MAGHDRCTHISQSIVFFVSIIMLVSSIACTTAITRDELLAQLQTDAPPLVVDVRSQGEYDWDHVPGAVHISFYAVGSGLDVLGHSKHDPIVLYCEHGPRASIAGISLYLFGHENVYSLEGHMRSWRKNEFPIEVITH